MKKWTNLMRVIIFNIAETLLIFLSGTILNISVNYILLIMLVFLITRATIGKALHFKDWYRCLVWSLLILFTLFVWFKFNMLQSVLITIYVAFLMTGKADIKDMFLWGGNDLNKRVYDWVRFNLNNPELISYENKLKEIDNKKYIIFKYRFREFKSYSQISKLMDIDPQRISEEINIMSHFIEFSIRIK